MGRGEKDSMDLMFDNTFGRTIDIVQRALDVSSLRRDVIANNIANAEVPNFKRSTVSFESALKKALDSEKNVPVLELEVTDPRHIRSYQPVDYRTVEPRRVLDYLSTAKNNGNNVDIEEETMLSLENQLLYTLLTQAESFEFGQINTILKS
jgi:flagellar basal-body rod protein FlgB